MTTTTLNGFIVRETELAYGYVGFPIAGEKTITWIARKKVNAFLETDGHSPAIQIKGEPMARLGTPVIMTVESAYLERIQFKG